LLILNFQGVCDKLIALQKSLHAQEQLPGHAERQTQVEDFKNRLEALASPSVVQCFAEGNTEQAKHYVQIFTSIQRLPQLQQYYRAVQIPCVRNAGRHRKLRVGYITISPEIPNYKYFPSLAKRWLRTCMPLALTVL